MADLVFISYSSQDADVARRICDTMESRGIACWIAPRDIPAGAKFETALLEAIESARAVLVLLSEAANRSQHVTNEVRVAYDHQKPLFPVRVEPVNVHGTLAYYLGSTQWVDAFGRDSENRLTEVACQLRRLSTTKPGIPQFWDLPMVDRDIERTELERLAERILWLQRGVVLMLQGPAGAGKSRLLEWYEHEIASRFNVRVCWGKHSTWDVPWAGFRQILENLFGLVDTPRSQAEQVIRSKLDAWGICEEDEIRRLIQLVVSDAETPPEATPGTSPRLMEMLMRILRRFAEDHPLALILEDMQLADSQSVRMLEYAVASLDRRPARLMILASARTEQMSANEPLVNALTGLSWYLGKSFERLELRYLEPEPAQTLIEQVLPGGLDAAGGLADCSQGSPLFILQLLRHLYQKRLLRHRSDRWQLAVDIDLDHEIPASLSELIADRIDALLSQVSQAEIVLSYAAAIGEQFHLELLQRALRVGRQHDAIAVLENVLGTFECACLIRVSNEDGKRTVRFVHNLVYLAARDRVLRKAGQASRISSVHVSVAKAEHGFFRERLNTYAAEIAEHYELGGDLSKAFELYVTAGWNAVRSFAFDDAVRLFADAGRVKSTDLEGPVKTLKRLADANQVSLATAREVLGVCLASVCYERRNSATLWSLGGPIIRTALASPAAAATSADLQVLLGLIVFLAQKEQQPTLWDDIVAVADMLIEYAESSRDSEWKARIHDYLGYVGESLANSTGVVRDGPAHALQGAHAYLAARDAGPSDLRRSLHLLEPAVWCLRRAGHYRKAIECCLEELGLTMSDPGYAKNVSDAIAAGLHLDIAECWLLECQQSGDSTSQSRAIEALHDAADCRRRHHPDSQAANWCETLALEVERTGTCGLSVPLDSTPADVLLVHNHYDTMAADLVREHFEALGQRCTSTGPGDSRELDELESTYDTIIVFGSIVAVGMERFAYLFQGEEGVWQIQPHLGDTHVMTASWWERPKSAGDGHWFLVAGYTRFATVLAADKFRHEALVRDV